MKLTQALNGPPVFRFWKEFGTGKDLKKRLGYFNAWQYIWNSKVRRIRVTDNTIPKDMLPPGACVMEAEDFLKGSIDAMPEQLLKIKRGQLEVYDHPWPFNVQLDPIKKQQPIHHYSIQTRLYVHKADAQILTNTLIETESLEARPPLEPQAQHIEQVQRKIQWATSGDSVLTRLPKKREWPKINLTPLTRYGITAERAETNVLKSIAHHAQAILASQKFNINKSLEGYANLCALSFPKCSVLFQRDSSEIGLDLCIDHMTASREPLPIYNEHVEETKHRELVDIKPRTWKSILEKTRFYKDDWSFKFPVGFYPRTIYLAARIKRNIPDDEMLARNVIHAYGLTRKLVQLNHSELPVALQVISFRLEPERAFFFTRFQLNSSDFSDIKNQAWHSGPVKDEATVLRYFLDFENIEDTISSERRNRSLNSS